MGRGLSLSDKGWALYEARRVTVLDRLRQRLLVAPHYLTYSASNRALHLQMGTKPLKIKVTFLSLSSAKCRHRTRFWPTGYKQSSMCDFQKAFKEKEHILFSLPLTFLQTRMHIWCLSSVLGPWDGSFILPASLISQSLIKTYFLALDQHDWKINYFYAIVSFLSLTDKLNHDFLWHKYPCCFCSSYDSVRLRKFMFN